MELSLVLQFWGIAVLLAMTPGADWAYAIAAGVRAPRFAPSILGMLFGYTIVIVVVALGVGAIVTEFPVVLTVLTAFGAAYLIWLGITTLRQPAEPITASDRDLGSQPLGQFLRGAGVSGINPKGLLLLLALLPQFISPTGFAAPLQMLGLGGLHLLNCAVIYSLVALLARRILRSKPQAAKIVTRTSGGLMVALGVLLVVEQVVVALT